MVVVIHLEIIVLYVDSSNRVWNTSVLYADVLAGPYPLQRSWKTVKIIEHCQYPE